jgi:hypothetical protein
MRMIWQLQIVQAQYVSFSMDFVRKEKKYGNVRMTPFHGLSIFELLGVYFLCLFTQNECF